MVQEEHKASLIPALEPLITIELRVVTASPNDQPIIVIAELSQAITA